MFGLLAELWGMIGFMGGHRVVSGVLVVIVFLTIVLTTFAVVRYSADILTAAVSFASTDQVAKLRECGVTLPDELFQFRSDIPGLLLPAMYIGFPGLLIAISLLMFVAGYFYGAGREWQGGRPGGAPDHEKTDDVPDADADDGYGKDEDDAPARRERRGRRRAR